MWLDQALAHTLRCQILAEVGVLHSLKGSTHLMQNPQPQQAA